MGDSFLSSLAGPAMGSASSLVSLYQSIRDGEDAASQTWRTFFQHLPGNNLFYTRLALDHMIGYSLQEALNPGSIRRLRRRIKKETGQVFIFEPTVWDWARGRRR